MTDTQPVVYEFQIQGRIDAEMAAWMGNFNITLVKSTTTSGAQSGSTITVLTGAVIDQAALFGILNRIRDLGLKLISVKQLNTI